MALFNRNKYSGGFMDTIRCDEQSYLIWKWHPKGTVLGANTRENAIRLGSSLRVKGGSVAVFVYKQNTGLYQDYIEGPYDGILETNNLPILSNLIGLAYAGNSPFQAEVYFINLAQIIQTRFAVPFFDVFDPRFLDYGVPVAVRGTISFKITNYRDFISLHRLDSFSLETFQMQIKDAVSRYVKSVVANAPEQKGIPVVQIERNILEINDLVEEKIKSRLYNDFGVTVSGVDIGTIEIDKSSDSYKKLLLITQDITAQTMQAKADVEIKEMKDSQKVGIMQRTAKAISDIKEDAYARRKQTQSMNFAAYQTEAAEHVGVAGAAGLGKMGSSNVGGNNASFNPTTMMAGMYIGSAIGQNLAGSINTVMGNMNKHEQNMRSDSATATVPPPIPTITYYVAVDGKAMGPYDLNSIEKMISSGTFTCDTLVWKQGMANWTRSGDVVEIAPFFNTLPPDMPPIPTA